MCISPGKLCMQSVAVKGSNKRCITTCLHQSVYEIARHSWWIFVFRYFDGNESRPPERTQQAQRFWGPLLATPKPGGIEHTCPCWDWSGDRFLLPAPEARFKGGGDAAGAILFHDMHCLEREEKQDPLEFRKQDSIIEISMRTGYIFQPLLKRETWKMYENSTYSLGFWGINSHILGFSRVVSTNCSSWRLFFPSSIMPQFCFVLFCFC